MVEMKPEVKVKNEVDVNWSQLWVNYKPRSTQLIRSGTTWLSQVAPEEGKGGNVDYNTKRRLKELAEQILKNDSACYSKKEEAGSKKQDAIFRRTVFTHGTSRDKVAAHVLRCMESPAHSLSNLNALISMVTPKAKGGYHEVFNALRELLESAFLPDGHVARNFETHNFHCLHRLMVSGREHMERQLALWYFEDQLLYAYHRLIRQLTQVCQDAVEKTKVQGMRCLVELVASNPNQDSEGKALAAVVNKLGDPSRKVSAITMVHLRTLLQRRPILKHQVVEGIEDLLYRSNVSSKAQYYCLCFLKDMIFRHDDQALAAKLLKLYFGFFKACTKKGEVDTRMMGALLRGINRAFPYTKLTMAALQQELNTLYKLCHFVNFAIAAQALQLIYQVTGSSDQVTDRFYQLVYHQLNDAAFGVSSATSAFLNLVFKALMRDTSIERIQAFVKRLLQVSLYTNPNVMAGVLYLVSEVAREKPAIATMTRLLSTNTGENDDDDDGLEVFPDVDDENSEVKDDVIIDAKKLSYDKNFEASKNNVGIEENTDTKPDIKPPLTASSWLHHQNTGMCRLTSYDPYHRNPLYAGAQYSPLWELQHLKAHYHPSVALFAGHVVEGQNVQYSGDPLEDFTLSRFLDRFVYRNPKKIDKTNNSGSNVLGSKSQYKPHGVRSIPVNSAEFSALKPEDVPEDQLFFHRYFTENAKKIKKENDDDDEAGSVDDDEFDEYLRRMNGCNIDDDEDADLDFASGAKASKMDVSDDDDDGDDFDDDDDDDFGDKFDDDGGDNIDGDDEGEDFVGDGDIGSDDDLDFDEEAVAFSDDDDFDMNTPKKKGKDITTKKNKKKGGESLSSMFVDDEDFDEFDEELPKKKGGNMKNSKKGGESLSSMFADAEDFDHLLEENAEEGMNPVTMQSMANKDRAHVKQINWEVDRDRRIKGQAWHKQKGRPGTKGDSLKKTKKTTAFKAGKNPSRFKASKNSKFSASKNTFKTNKFKSIKGPKKLKKGKR